MSERTILIINKDPNLLKIFQSDLERNGFSVVKATSAAEAHHEIQLRRPADFLAVVADYQMPKGNVLKPKHPPEGAEPAVGKIKPEAALKTSFDLALKIGTPTASGNTLSPLALAPPNPCLQLLGWIKKIDSALAVIIVGDPNNSAAVEASLRHGAIDFLEKPVSLPQLKEALEHACSQTVKNRRLLTAEKSVRAVAHMNHFFRSVLGADILPHLQIHYTPHDQVGGDFVNVLPLSKNKTLLLVGDVSGHDLRAGFVSAYFQGLVKGLCHAYTRRVPHCEGNNFCALGNSAAALGICENFNKILVEEWERRDGSAKPFQTEPRTTLSLLAVEITLNKRKHPLPSSVKSGTDNAVRLGDKIESFPGKDEEATAVVVNCGAPPLRIVRQDGSETVMAPMNPPLGWSTSEPLESQSISLKEVAHLLLATDGFYDWAETLGRTPAQLAHALLDDRRPPGGTPPDDLLVLKYKHGEACR